MIEKTNKNVDIFNCVPTYDLASPPHTVGINYKYNTSETAKSLKYCKIFKLLRINPNNVA